MVIQHNICAMNANRMLGINNCKIASSCEKLSSGYKINRAADDAAGLSISEKMRKRIRGLEKGMENVEDGISLCQVADGALNEVTDLIQRARELSIKAYNGTNSKSDRQIIQDEIEQCINEVGRIFETTKFNEVYVFQNGQEVHGTYLDTEPYTVTRSMTMYRDLPSWLKINDAVVPPGTYPNIEEHTGYTGITQDLTGIMPQDFKLNDGSYVKLYFGPDKGNVGGYEWIGDFIKDTNKKGYHELLDPGGKLHDYIYATDAGGYKHIDNPIDMNYKGWTGTITDNVSAKVDFSGIAGKTNASELYNALSELVGVEMKFPCGTCPTTDSVYFSGEFEGMNNLKFHSVTGFRSRDGINLSGKNFSWNGNLYSGYFDAITDVMALNDTDPTKITKTTDLSNAIAKDLASSVYSILDRDMQGHYDRAIQNPSEPYCFYVYDYRDTDAVKPDATMSQIVTSSHISFDYLDVDTTGRMVEYDYWDEGQIWIQASDEVPDGMNIKSSYLSLKKLGLTGYTVNNYYSEVKMRDPDDYYRRLAQWQATAPPPTIKKTTKKVTVQDVVKPAKFDVFYENGEKVRKMVSPPVVQTKEEDREIIEYVYNEDNKPVPEYDVTEIYAPSDIKILDDALSTISKVRSYYGASQNRLEHTYRNNDNAHENITYAESRIRDTDMADEMVNNSKLNILRQAGLSMLSQANQSNQGVLSLIA